MGSVIAMEQGPEMAINQEKLDQHPEIENVTILGHPALFKASDPYGLCAFRGIDGLFPTNSKYK